MRDNRDSGPCRSPARFVASAFWSKPAIPSRASSSRWSRLAIWTSIEPTVSLSSSSRRTWSRQARTFHTLKATSRTSRRDVPRPEQGVVLERPRGQVEVQRPASAPPAQRGADRRGEALRRLGVQAHALAQLHVRAAGRAAPRRPRPGRRACRRSRRTACTTVRTKILPTASPASFSR